MGHFRFRKLGIWCHTPHQGLLMSLLFMKPFSMSQHVVRSTWTDKSWHIIHSSLVFCTLLCGSSQTLAPYFYFFSQQWFILCLKWFTWNFSIVFYPFNCSWTTIDIHMSQSSSNNSYTWPHVTYIDRAFYDIEGHTMTLVEINGMQMLSFANGKFVPTASSTTSSCTKWDWLWYT